MNGIGDVVGPSRNRHFRIARKSQRLVGVRNDFARCWRDSSSDVNRIDSQRLDAISVRQAQAHTCPTKAQMNDLAKCYILEICC